MLKYLHLPVVYTVVKSYASAFSMNRKSAKCCRTRSEGSVLWGSLLLFFLGFALSGSANATPIIVTYTASKVSGTTWQYDYKLTGTFVSGDDLSVYFPQATSLNLVDLGTGGTDWTTFVFQPSSTLPADGEYDMLANKNNPSLSPSFNVQFDFLGTGSPGSQAFTLFDPNFNIAATGFTQAPSSSSTVPEPAPFVLVGSALFGALRSVRRRVQN